MRAALTNANQSPHAERRCRIWQERDESTEILGAVSNPKDLMEQIERLGPLDMLLITGQQLTMYSRELREHWLGNKHGECQI